MTFAPTPPADAPKVLGVKALVARMKRTLDLGFRGVEVEGEITGAAFPRSGHAYFDLVEGEAKLPAVFFKGAMGGQPPAALQNGNRVRVTGNITLYERRGSYQIIVRRLEAAGIGDLLAALERLRVKLHAEGLFAEERKKPLPWMPRSVGVVTSPTGAAIRDIVRTIHNRFPARILVAPARVQGGEAVREVVAGIELLDRLAEVEVMIVGRGGGSLEDLLPFSDERVVRAIAAARTPIISAVGHEVDTPLADFAADIRAATPTAAGELAVPDLSEILAELDYTQERLELGARRRITEERQGLIQLARRLRSPAVILQSARDRLEGLERQTARGGERRVAQAHQDLVGLERRLRTQHPVRQLREQGHKLERLEERLRARAQRSLDPLRRALEQAERQLHALSPSSHLERGYAIVRQGGRVLRAAGDAELGSQVEVLLAAGALHAEVRGHGPGPFDELEGSEG